MWSNKLAFKCMNVQIKLRWALFVTYTIIQSIMRSEMCSLHLTHPSAHTWSSGQPTLQRPGSSLHLTHPKRIRTWSSGQPSYGTQVAVRGSVLCSRALQSWCWIKFLPAWDSNLQTLGYKPNSLTIRPRLPHDWIFSQSWYSCL